METSKKYSSISEGILAVVATMHAQGVSHVKAVVHDSDGALELELHVPVPRVLSPVLEVAPQAPERDHDEDPDEEPQWKKQSRALNAELELD